MLVCTLCDAFEKYCACLLCKVLQYWLFSLATLTTVSLLYLPSMKTGQYYRFMLVNYNA